MLSRCVDRRWSFARKWMLIAIAICAPLHAAFAQNQMTLASGDNQSAQAGQTFPQPLTVQFSGPPSGSTNVQLHWQITAGNGYFQESGVSTYDATLFTSAGSTSSVTLISNSQGALTVTAQCVAGCDTAPFTVVFHETATPPPAYLEMDISGGNNQTGAPGTTLPTPLSVKLIPTSAGYEGPFTEAITWTVESGSATFAENHSTTYTENVSLGGSPGRPSQGSTGHRAASPLATAAQSFRAQVSLILGSTPGPVVIRVTCPDCTVGAARIFRETVASSTTSSLEKVSGDLQSGLVGSQAAAPLVVQLPGGSGQTISWTVLSGQATLSSSTTTIDANGQSSISFRYGNTAGPISIQASAGSAGQVTFTETATTGTTTVVSGNNQTGTAGGMLQPFVLQVGSATQGASGIVVTWSVLQGGGTLMSPTTTTDSNGRTSNTLTLGPNAGPNIVQASVPGFGTTTFTANGIAGIPGGSVFTIVSGNNQALIPNQSSQPLVVKLTSSTGQGIAGVTIQWAVSGSSGSLDSTTTTTDATGQSQNHVKVILPAAYTVTAQVANQPEIPPLTFTFDNAVANLPSLNAGQIGVAHAIDRACPALAAAPSLTAPQQDLLQRCSEIVVGSGANPQQVPEALNQMLNNKTQPQTGLADSVLQGQLTNLNTRMAELRQGARGFSIGGLALNENGRSLPASSLGDVFTSYRKDPKESTDDEVGKDFERWGFFATGLIDRGGASADGMSPGFDFHNASITAGADYRFNDAFVGGLALGYASNNSELDLNAGKVNVDSYSLNAYFTWYRNNDFYVEGSAVADWLNYDLRRNIVYQIASLSGGTTNVNQTASAAPDGKQYSLSLSVGKDFNRGAWTFSPYVRGVYSHVSLDGFSETLSDPNAPGGGLGTSVESRSFTSELGVLGGRVSRTISMDWGVLVPNAVLEWNHEFKNDPQTVVTRFLADPTQTPIFITDSGTDQNFFNVGFGLNAIFPKGRSGFLYYEHVTGLSGIHENRLSAGIRIEF